MDRLKWFFGQLAAFWAGLSTPKRLALVGVTSFALLALLLFAYFGSQNRYAYLYTNLDAQDASGIVEKLKSLQVPYRLDADGRGILVPDDRIASLRLELASSGLPKGGGVGFELFDRSQLGATEFEQQVSLRRALEGEITRSILTIEGVKAARVHLVMPERRLFVSEGNLASASIVVKLSNPEAFGKREVAAVVHLVAAAVPGLRRDRVSVVSTDGLTLHRPNTGSGDDSATSEEDSSEMSSAVAARLEGKVRSQLERVVGTGNAEVRVAVDLDTSRQEKVEEHYDPSKTALRSENKTEEHSGETTAGVAGVPGALTNLPDANQPGAQAAETPAGPEGSVVRVSQTRNWEVDKISQKTTRPPGKIERLSVSVLLNDRLEDRNGKLVAVTRSESELKKLDEMVKTAVGFQAERGDTVAIESAAFIRPSGNDLTHTTPVPLWRRWLIPGAAALAGLLLFAVVILVWRKANRASAPRPRVAALANGRDAAAGALGTALGATGLPAGHGDRALPEGQKVDAPLRRARALQLASEDPATAAVVIRKWLNVGTS